MEIRSQAHSLLNVRPNLIVDFILASIREHERVLSDGAPETVRKRASESAVTLVTIDGFPQVCVKEFRWRGYIHAAKGFLRHTQGRRTFRNGYRLNRNDINAAYPLALIRRETRGLIRSEWVVMQSVSQAMELDRYVINRVASSWGVQEKRELVTSLGRFIGQMHMRGVFHSDLKTCNILVVPHNLGDSNPGGTLGVTDLPSAQHVEFVLVDYDDVTFSNAVSTRARVRNLVQIFLSTPLVISFTDRVRFLNEYAVYSGITSKQKRFLAIKVLEASRGKDILYVGFHGDVIEKWDSPIDETVSKASI